MKQDNANRFLSIDRDFYFDRQFQYDHTRKIHVMSSSKYL